jgi:ribonuclease HII
MPDFELERALGDGRDGGLRVVGLDEVGRGPWAGPVVAAAAWLEPARLPSTFLDALDDSKKLSHARRESLFEAMTASASKGLAFALGEASVAEIDRLNILQASLLAMTRAVAALGFRPDAALVDGNRAPDLPCPARTVVGGDGRSLSIAAASIIAKVTRDRGMRVLAERHPGYGWERNAGYGTAEHRPVREALTITG